MRHLKLAIQNKRNLSVHRQLNTTSMTRQILVTSALPYANGPIHIGHLVEYIQTDIWVRFQKLRGHRCIYVCADDTHGTAIMIRAKQEGRTEEELIAEMQQQHERDFASFDVEFDNYGSTNSEENRQQCHAIWKSLRAADLIVEKEVTQLFDLWPGFSADRTHPLSQTLQKAYYLTRWDKRPHAEALQGRQDRVASLVEYCRGRRLKTGIIRGLLRAGIDSLTFLSLLRADNVAKMTFVENVADAQKLKEIVNALRREQPLDPVYSLSHHLIAERSKVTCKGRFEYLDLAKSPETTSEEAKSPARRSTLVVKSTFGLSKAKPKAYKKMKVSPGKANKRNHSNSYVTKICASCHGEFSAFKTWYFCQACHEEQRRGRVRIPQSAHTIRNWMGLATSPAHDVTSNGSLSSTDSYSSGYHSSSSRGFVQSSVFYCPNYGCHFFGKTLGSLEVNSCSCSLISE